MKKTTLYILAVLCLLAAIFIIQCNVLAKEIKKYEPPCLYGKVKIVNSFPDYKVKIVDSFPDLKVKIVDSFPDKCGEWQFVDSFPDFTIQFVDSFPDFTIKHVNSFPGRN